MSQELTTTKPQNALASLAGRYGIETASLATMLKNTCFRGATDDEFKSLVIIANTYGLNPITKEIYAFPAKGGGIVPVVSVDGWIHLMNSHPAMDGYSHSFEHDQAGKLISCTVEIRRKDRSSPIVVTEYLAECKRPTEPWKMEHRMLRHKATIQCSRIAFGFSGITDEDEADRINNVRDVTPASGSKLFAAKELTAATEPLAVNPTHADLGALVDELGCGWPAVAKVLADNGMIEDADLLLMAMHEHEIIEIVKAWPQITTIINTKA